MFGFTAYAETPFAEAITVALANAFIPSTEAVSYVNSLGYVGIAFTDVTGVTSSSTVEGIETQAQAVHDYGSVSVTTSIKDFDSVEGKAALNIPAAPAASGINDITLIAKAVQSLSSIPAQFEEPSLDIQAKAVITTGSVSANTYYEDLAEVIALANIDLNSPGLTISLNKPTYTLDNFDYEALKDAYSRERTIYLLGYSGSNTTYVNR